MSSPCSVESLGGFTVVEIVKTMIVVVPACVLKRVMNMMKVFENEICKVQHTIINRQNFKIQT